MKYSELVQHIKEKKSLLCIGLDSDFDKIPEHLKKYEDPIFEFNKQIIDATHEYAIAYKPNTAFYEALGYKGWRSLERTADYLNEQYPDHLTIADAKRGDIGNTSKKYAEAFFDRMDFDAITINPYLGKDAADPFLEYEDKWVILLGLSSNPSAYDLQLIQEIESRDYIFEKVFRYGRWWSDESSIMYVVGATMAYKLQQIRHIVPEHFLLVPGIGSQGGDLEEVCKFGLNSNYGLIVNSSRSIIFADSTEKFAEKANEMAAGYQKQMAEILEKLNEKKKRRRRR